jgi:hypothetical protein
VTFPRDSLGASYTQPFAGTPFVGGNLWPTVAACNVVSSAPYNLGRKTKKNNQQTQKIYII